MSRNKYSNFGRVVSTSLSTRLLTQVDLSVATGVSPSYTNQIMTGRKRASPLWADLIADVLNMPDAERRRLHKAAAIDHGFKLDLKK